MGRALAKTSPLTWLDGATWLARCQEWSKPEIKWAKAKNDPRRNHNPLIVTGHGAGVHVNNGALVVKHGFTHFPQKLVEERFFPKDPNLPPRIIILDGTGSISFDAIDWLAVQAVPLIRINYRGEVQCILGGTGYSADPRKAAQQMEWKRQRRDVEIARSLIKRKVENSIETLEDSVPKSPLRENSLSKLDRVRRELRSIPPKSIRSLLGREGQAAIAYFEAWQSVPIQWSGTKRRPIPNNWYRMGIRSSYARKRIENRNASHPVNAMLNYAYAVLQSQVQIHAISAGYDPTIGFLHAIRPDRLTFVLDLMEPLRPVMDRVILRFIQERRFQPADFTLRKDGVCRLNSQTAKHLVTILATSQQE